MVASIVVPQHFVDVVDVALLHVIAMIGPDVKNERLFAFAEPFNWNRVLQFFREKFPERKFREDFPGLGEDLSIIDRKKRAVQLLKGLGKDGFTSFEESVYNNVKDLA